MLRHRHLYATKAQASRRLPMVLANACTAITFIVAICVDKVIRATAAGKQKVGGLKSTLSSKLKSKKAAGLQAGFSSDVVTDSAADDEMFEAPLEGADEFEANYWMDKGYAGSEAGSEGGGGGRAAAKLRRRKTRRRRRKEKSPWRWRCQNITTGRSGSCRCTWRCWSATCPCWIGW